MPKPMQGGRPHGVRRRWQDQVHSVPRDDNDGSADDDNHHHDHNNHVDNNHNDNHHIRSVVLHELQRADLRRRLWREMLAVNGWHLDVRQHLRILQLPAV